MSLNNYCSKTWIFSSRQKYNLFGQFVKYEQVAPALSLFMIVPPANIIMLWYLAFAERPSLKRPPQERNLSAPEVVKGTFNGGTRARNHFSHAAGQAASVVVRLAAAKTPVVLTRGMEHSLIHFHQPENNA
ncbi:MAG: hypothetical protein ABSF91_15295 [Bacteroidota bacterium]|jgi:hypothetical protein